MPDIDNHKAREALRAIGDQKWRRWFDALSEFDLDTRSFNALMAYGDRYDYSMDKLKSDLQQEHPSLLNMRNVGDKTLDHIRKSLLSEHERPKKRKTSRDRKQDKKRSRKLDRIRYYKKLAC